MEYISIFLERVEKIRRNRKAYRDQKRGRKIDYLTADQQVEFEKYKEYIIFYKSVNKRNRDKVIFSFAYFFGFILGGYLLSEMVKNELYQKIVILLIVPYFVLTLIYLYIRSPKHYGTRAKHRIIKVFGFATTILIGLMMVVQGEVYNLIVLDKEWSNAVYSLGALIAMFSPGIIGVMLMKKVSKTKEKVTKIKSYYY